MIMLDEITKGQKPDIRDGNTFFSSKPIECPSCENEVYQESILSGKGRLDAGELREDLYRNYNVTEEFGNMYPFLYAVTTCPKCLYTTFSKDFLVIHKRNKKTLFHSDMIHKRKKTLSFLFKKIPDFKQKKDIMSAFASYLLAMDTYNEIRSRDSPSIRMAICSLRSAWIAKILEEHKYGDFMKTLKDIFYRKSYFFYKRSLQYDTIGKESLGNIWSLGPDIDKDYGYEGVVYLLAWYVVKYESLNDPTQRRNELQKARTNLSKVFGFGKASREKPSILLSIARDVFDKTEKEMHAILLE